MLRRILGASDALLLACEESVARELANHELDLPLTTFARLGCGGTIDPVPPDHDEVVFVQFSSGSTTDPRGCMLTARAIAWQLQALADALDIDPERDNGVAWLPLAHDMGLFGCLLLTYWTGHRLALSSPQRFLSDPSSWLQDCAYFGATVSATPNFGLEIAARVARHRLPAPFPMRRMVIGGERVSPQTLCRAHAVLGDERLPMGSLLPAYGLAEAVLAVTMTPVGRGPRLLSLDREALSNGAVVEREPETSGADVVTLVSAGPPLPGNIVTTSGGRVAEVRVTSPSLAAGYLEVGGLSRGRFLNGLRTGDLGFIADGELFVSGRLDDLMCLAGRNIYATDIEAAIDQAAGISTGKCAVVDVNGNDETRLVALIEVAGTGHDFKALAAGIRAQARRAVGIAIQECLFLPRGHLPKTPSGKIQRFRCRELATDGSVSSSFLARY